MRYYELTEALTTPYQFDTFNDDVTQIRKNAMGQRKDRAAANATFYTSEGRKYKIVAYRIGYTKADRERIEKANQSTDDLIPFNFEYENGGIWEVHFSLISMDDEGKEVGRNERTGTGDALRVFATVFKFIEKFAEIKNPSIISVKSKLEDEQRSKLYKKMAQRYAGQIGYSVYSERHVGDKYRLELRKT